MMKVLCLPTRILRIPTKSLDFNRNRSDSSCPRRICKGGSRFTGFVGVLRKDGFELIQRSPNHDVVPYDHVAAFLDPATGKVLAAVQQRGIGGVGRPSVKKTAIIMLWLLG